MSVRAYSPCVLFGVIALSVAVSAQSVYADFPYVGEVTGTASTVNVRSGPSTNFYPVVRLAPGERVTVVGEESGWYAIEPTSGSYSLISKHYVDVGAGGEGVVNGNSVRVRAGSDLDKHRYAVQRKLDKGDVLRIIGEDGDGFLKIEPPDGARLWIHADYVVQVPGERLALEPAVAKTETIATAQPVFEQDPVIDEAPEIQTPAFRDPASETVVAVVEQTEPEPQYAEVEQLEAADSFDTAEETVETDSRMVASAIEEARATDHSAIAEPFDDAVAVEVEVIEPEQTQVARWGDDEVVTPAEVVTQVDSAVDSAQIDSNRNVATQRNLEPYITNVEPVDRLHAAVVQQNAASESSRNWENSVAADVGTMEVVEIATPVNDAPTSTSTYIPPPATPNRSSRYASVQPSSMYTDAAEVYDVNSKTPAGSAIDPRDPSVGYVEVMETMEVVEPVEVSAPSPVYASNRQPAIGQPSTASQPSTAYDTATTRHSIYSDPVATRTQNQSLVEPIEQPGTRSYGIIEPTGDPRDRVNESVDRLALAARQRSPQYQQPIATPAQPSSITPTMTQAEPGRMVSETIAAPRETNTRYTQITYAETPASVIAHATTPVTAAPMTKAAPMTTTVQTPMANDPAPVFVERAPEPDLDELLFKGGDEKAHLEMLDKRFEREMSKPVEDRFFGALAKAYTEFSQTAEDQVVRLYSERRLSQVELAQATADAIRDIRSLNQEVGRQRRLALEERSQMQPPPRLVTRGFDAKGELRKSMIFSSPVGPKRFRLVDPAMVVPRTMCYVEVPADMNIDMEQYLGRLVGIRASRKYLETGNVDPINVVVAEEFVVLDPSELKTPETERPQASAWSTSSRTSHSGLVAVGSVDTRD